MTAGLYISSVCDAIAGISISGVTVKDRNEIVGNWNSMPNVLYPNPNGSFITGFSMKFDSMLQGANAPITLNYTLNYRFLGTAIGDLSTFTTAYSAIMDKIILIVNAIIANPAPYSGRIQMSLGDVTMGAKEDPAGNMYHGADFSILIEELQN